MIPILRIQLLGSFDLSYGDASLTGAISDRLQSLLSYLVLNRQKAKTRQQLAVLFWADSTDAQARTNLRRVIHELRQVLPAVESFITINTKTLQWRLDAPFVLDVMEFEQAIADAEAAEQANDSQAAQVALEKAVALYLGTLLPNCYDEWIELEQERLNQDCIRVYSSLIRLLQEQQEYSTAIRYAQRLLQLDPLSETAYAYLIQLYGLSGDRANALQVYHRCMTVLRDELGVDPSAATRDIYDRLLHEIESGGMREQGSREVGERGGESQSEIQNSKFKIQNSPTPHTPHPAPLIDWGNSPDVSLFYGRTDELNTLMQWTGQNRCKVVALLGMGGIGKTALSVKVAQLATDWETDEADKTGSTSVSSAPKSVANSFEFVIWRSLRNAPPLETLLAGLVPFISNQQDTDLTLNRLMHWLRQFRCLLILDNMETLLQEGQQVGHYRTGYEDYGELIRLMGETNHQSCLMLTSREKPTDVSTLEEMDLPVRAAGRRACASLLLSGSPEATIALVQAKGLFGSEQQQQQLCQFYGHNPLALKIVATSIQDLFDGDIAAFLSHDAIMFNGVHQLIQQQFQRCTPLEKTVMSWLAINREWTSIAELVQNIVPRVTRSQLLEALESLRWRSLLEKQAGRYTQQPVVMEFVTDQLVEQVCTELAMQTQDFSQSILQSHALIKSQSSDYIRETQIREIIQPILSELLRRLGDRDQVEQQFRKLLHHLRSNSPRHPNYAGGNLFNLFKHLCQRLEGCDFSHLALWQADLRDVTLHDCNLADSDLSQVMLTETLSLPLAIAFSADGKLLATGDANSEVRIWSVAEGRNLQTFLGHTDWVWSIAFSPDGHFLASGSSDRTIKLWSLATGACTQTLRGHELQVWSVSFHPTGKWLASGSEDQTIKLWNPATGDCALTLTGHTGLVRSVAFSPLLTAPLSREDGGILASSGDDGTVRLWDISTGTGRILVEGQAQRVWAIAFSPDDDLLAVSHDRTISIWQLSTGTCIHTLEGHSNWVRSIAFNADGQLLASGSEDRTIKIWQMATGHCCQTLIGHKNWVRSVAFSANGELLASGGGDHTVKFWQVATGHCRRTLQGYVNRVWSVAFCPATTGEFLQLASAHDDHTIKLWRVNQQQCDRTLSDHHNSVCAIAFSPQGDLLASGSEDQMVKLWNPQTGRCLQTFEGHSSRIWSVAFNLTGQLLASGSEDQTVNVWNIQTGRCLHRLKGHTNWVCSVAVSPLLSGIEILASGSYDQTIRLWHVQTGECLQTLEGHANWVWSIAFSPNGQLLASGSGDHTIKLWHVETGKCLKTLLGHSSRIWSVAFSPDGQLLASGSSDRTVKVWNVHTGACLRTLEGHTNLAWTVAFSPDGTLIASGSQDETIRLWNLQTGECVATLRSPRPYEGTTISRATGITEAQRSTLKQLGAVD